MSKRPLVLLVPPILECSTGPFLGVTNLKAYLNATLEQPVELLDWNIECLSSKSFFEGLGRYLQFLQQEFGSKLPEQYPVFLKQIKAICADFDNPRLREYKVATVQLLFRKLLSERDLTAIPRYLVEKNLYRIWKEFFASRLRYWEDRPSPCMLGVSVSYYTQLVPALIISYLFKEQFQQVPVVLGGNFFWHLPSAYLKSVMALPWIDFIVQYEGEQPLKHLISACEGFERLENVPNLVWRQGKEVVFNACAPPLSLQDAPPPDFKGLPLHLYSTGVLPYFFSRGCYWAKCNFCDIPSYTASDSIRYFYKMPAKVVRDIQGLQGIYGDHPFYLVTTAMPPLVARAFVEQIEQAEAHFNWLTMVRADQRYTPDLTHRMYRAGCRHVAIGLESANDRVLGLMNKGITRSIFQEVFSNFTSAGIQVMVEVLVDFPGTTETEAWETFEFLKENRSNIQNVNISEFVLAAGCKVAQFPEQFAVKLGRDCIDSWHGFDRPTYETCSGMSYTLGKEVTKRIRLAWAALNPDEPLQFLNR